MRLTSLVVFASRQLGEVSGAVVLPPEIARRNLAALVADPQVQREISVDVRHVQPRKPRGADAFPGRLILDDAGQRFVDEGPRSALTQDLDVVARKARRDPQEHQVAASIPVDVLRLDVVGGDKAARVGDDARPGVGKSARTIAPEDRRDKGRERRPACVRA